MSSRLLDIVTEGRASEAEEFDTAQLQHELHVEVVSRYQVQELVQLPREELRLQLREILNELLKERPVALTRTQHDELVLDTIDEIIGFGPLERLLKMDGVSDILINGPDKIFVEVDGKLKLSDVRFRDEEHLVHIVRRVVSTAGRRIDESNPLVDARMPDGTRLNAVLSPIALNGATLSLRKFNKGTVGAQDLIKWKSASEEMVTFLEACIRGRLNTLVIGGTGSGKTTLLNILSSFIPDDERIITIEDAAELKLGQPHVVSMETRPPNVEGHGEVTTRMLVKNSLRMRPDRIVVGEIRGEEAIDMLQALNTGHDGSMSTVHANSPAHAVSRLQVLVGLTHGNMAVAAIREIIADALDLIVHMKRCVDGVRRVMSVTEVIGFDDGEVKIQEIMRFKADKMIDGVLVGEYVYTGVEPHCKKRLEEHGVKLPVFQSARGDG